MFVSWLHCGHGRRPCRPRHFPCPHNLPGLTSPVQETLCSARLLSQDSSCLNPQRIREALKFYQPLLQKFLLRELWEISGY